MKYLFFLSHPAHFHLFKHVIKKLQKKHEIKIVIKSKDVLSSLVENEGFDYINAQKKEKKANGRYQILIKSIWGLLVRDFNLFKIAIRFKPNLMIGTEWAIVHVGKLLNIPSLIVNEDDTLATPENKYFYPLATTLLLPDCCDQKLWGKKKISYSGYHELAYLHPNHFAPNKDTLKKYGIEKQYSIIRLVKLNASHDAGKTGINRAIISKLIELLESVGQVIITSEKQIDGSFEKYRLSISPIDMHHIMAFSNVFIGDSQTMAAEAGVLGIPFIRYNDFVGKIGYLNELENEYRLGFGYKIYRAEDMLNKVKELVAIPKIKNEWVKRRNRMLLDKIDVAQFMSWFIENYPDSIQTMKENPNSQYQFKHKTSLNSS